MKKGLIFLGVFLVGCATTPQHQISDLDLCYIIAKEGDKETVTPLLLEAFAEMSRRGRDCAKYKDMIDLTLANERMEAGMDREGVPR